MAACYDPQMIPAPATLPAHANPPQNTMACVGLLYDSSSNRTFRIPDVPQTSTVAHIKQWYASNVADNSVDPRTLVVIHNAQPTEDSTQVWQLAQGQGQFAVTVAPAHSPRSILEVYVDTALPIAPVRLCISSDSTVLYVKQRLFEMLNLPMAMASASNTALMLAHSTTPLQNSCTLEACNVLNNSRLVFTFQPMEAAPQSTPLHNNPPVMPVPELMAPPNSRSPSQSQFARIQEIWASDASSSSNSSASSSPIMSPMSQSVPASGDLALLPSLLLEDDEAAMVPLGAPSSHNNEARQHTNNIDHLERGIAASSNNRKNRTRRNQRSRSPPGMSGHQHLNQEQLQHLAANFRTKSCRNGPACKFGRNCWFAHTAEELRKPSDALPNNLPAVHKLERYSHREANAAKERN